MNDFAEFLEYLFHRIMGYPYVHPHLYNIEKVILKVNLELCMYT